MKPIMDQINSFRRAHVLSSLRRLAETWSRIAQISQEPAAFEFSRRELPPAFHFVGPLRLPGGYPPAPFPYEQLDGRPIFYVSMGTLQNRVPTLYRRIAESGAELDAQLVITLGGGLEPGTLADLPGRPVVVSYAPQLELLCRSTLAISHAGLNTVLDALRVCSKSLCCGPSPWSLVPKPIPVLRPGQPTEHQLNHADPDLRLAGISQVFIILAVNPAPTQPAEGSLHHPPPRQQLKPSVPGRSADDLNHIPPVLRDPSVQGVIVVLGVRPQLPQARERFSRQLAEDLRCRRRIIHGRTGHGHG